MEVSAGFAGENSPNAVWSMKMLSRIRRLANAEMFAPAYRRSRNHPVCIMMSTEKPLHDQWEFAKGPLKVLRGAFYQPENSPQKTKGATFYNFQFDVLPMTIYGNTLFKR